MVPIGELLLIVMCRSIRTGRPEAAVNHQSLMIEPLCPPLSVIRWSSWTVGTTDRPIRKATTPSMRAVVAALLRPGAAVLVPVQDHSSA
jgi:hypothetical protein